MILEVPGSLFAGETQSGITYNGIQDITKLISNLTSQGTNLLVTLGAGNFQSAIQYSHLKTSRISQDATARLMAQVNGIILSESCASKGIISKLLIDTEPFEEIAEIYSTQIAEASFAKGEVVISATGVENGLFDEDLAAALRAVELNAKALIKVTTKDLSPYFSKTDNELLINYDDAMKKLDFPIKGSAISFAAEYNLPILIHGPNFEIKLNEIEIAGIRMLR